jgi:hypothetical protein
MQLDKWLDKLCFCQSVREDGWLTSRETFFLLCRESFVNCESQTVVYKLRAAMQSNGRWWMVEVVSFVSGLAWE